jgi:hypothetical protein
MILLGQFTVAGELDYGLNIMIRTPEGKSIRYVYDHPGEGELVLPFLKGGVNHYQPITKAERKRFQKEKKQKRK